MQFLRKGGFCLSDLDNHFERETRMISNLKQRILSLQGRGGKPNLPIYLFCHHKGGTVLLLKVFRKLCDEFDWSLEQIVGQCRTVPPNVEVVLLMHSQIDFDAIHIPPFVGVHLRRDPRDVIVSGYLYHRRCSEPWCINTDLDFTSPIVFPRVPYSQEHRSESWKRDYLKSLKGQSYQQILLDLNQEDGLLFEMDHYGSWTIEDMLNWNYEIDNILEVKFEEIMSMYDISFLRILEHCGFSGQPLQKAVQISFDEDLNRMSDDELENNAHIVSRETGKWEKYFTPTLETAFSDRFGDALVRLGYESD
jgi:hypothetical protein